MVAPLHKKYRYTKKRGLIAKKGIYHWETFWRTYHWGLKEAPFSEDYKRDPITEISKKDPITEKPKETTITEDPKQNPINEDHQEFQDPQSLLRRKRLFLAFWLQYMIVWVMGKIFDMRNLALEGSFSRHSHFKIGAK